MWRVLTGTVGNDLSRDLEVEEVLKRYPFFKAHAGFLWEKCRKREGDVVGYSGKGKRNRSPYKSHDAYVLISECGE
jgi:hypothetical protein